MVTKNLAVCSECRKYGSQQVVYLISVNLDGDSNAPTLTCEVHGPEVSADLVYIPSGSPAS